MLYIVTQYYTSYHLDYKEKLILKNYDIFKFFDIMLCKCIMFVLENTKKYFLIYKYIFL